MNDAERYLMALHPIIQSGTYLELRCLRDHAAQQLWFTTPGPLILTAQAWSAKHWHCYVSVHARSAKHGGDAQVPRLSALVADIDAKCWPAISVEPPANIVEYSRILSAAERPSLPEENSICGNSANYARGSGLFSLRAALSAVGTFPLRPSLAVCSGGGVQAYWLLDHPVPQAEMTSQDYRTRCHRLAKAICGPDRAPDLIGTPESVLRLPGTLNWKAAYTPARPVTLLWSEPQRYCTERIDSWLDAHAAWTRPAEPPRAFTPRGDGDSLLEDFNNRYDLGALLVAHGARELPAGPRCRYFAKAGQRSISATLDYYPGKLVLQAETFLGLSKQHRHGYDAFAVFMHLEQGGDFLRAKEAAKALGYGPQITRYGLPVTRTTGRSAINHLLKGAPQWAS